MQPAIGMAPVAAANFTSAWWPVSLGRVALMSAISFSWQQWQEPPAEASPGPSDEMHHSSSEGSVSFKAMGLVPPRAPDIVKVALSCVGT